MKKIPKSFRLFGTKINVVFKNKNLNDKGCLGESKYTASEIRLSKTNGTEKISKDKIIDVFYHEKIHMILDTMTEHDLSGNEKFVDVFAKLLRQSDETEKY